MRFILFCGLLAVVAAWAPGGLIHQGQRRTNPQAQPLALQLVSGCDPTTPDWRGCK